MKAFPTIFFLFVSALFLSNVARAAEETIRGVLEKTVRPGACAQIKDALGEWYYITKSEEAEKLIAPFLGKNKKVIITGIAEQREGDPAFYFSIKSAQEPPAPPVATPSRP